MNITTHAWVDAMLFVQTTDPLPVFPTCTRRPSFYAIRALAQLSSRPAPTSLSQCPTVRHAPPDNHPNRTPAAP